MKILIATDGSEASKSVIGVVCQMVAKPENTMVKIVSVVEALTPIAAEPFAVSAEYYAEIEAGMSKQAETFVEQAEADLKEICPNLSDVSNEVFRSSEAAQAIVETAKKWNADLIVVGSHGYGFWSRALLGSVSNSVVNHAPCSVLIVRGETDAKS